MKVWLVMEHEGAAEDDAAPGIVERIFLQEADALRFLEGHVAKMECGIEKVLAGTAAYHGRKVPVARCLCDEQGWSIDEWEVEGT